MSSLLIDAGNTRLKWGVFSGGRWLGKGSLPSTEAPSFSAQLGAALTRLGPVKNVLACSVAGETVDSALTASLPVELASRLTWFRSDPSHGGLVNSYRLPTRLGADRWAAAIAAWQRVGSDCLVVSAGTATTIDVVRVLQNERRAAAGGARAEFAGGVILPGLRMMRAALAAGTAQLPEAQGNVRELPDNTDDAITTGCLEAQLGAIDRMRRRLPADAPLILGGGAAPALVPWLDGVVILVDDLVLEGLAVVVAETAAG